MTATTELPVRVEPRPEPTSGLRRVGLVLAMFLAPWGFVITNVAYALAIRDGGNEDTSLDTLGLYATHPDLVRLAVVAGSIGCLLLVPAVLGVFRLAPTSRLVLVGGSMMIAGYACYLAILHASLTTLAMAQQGGATETFAAVLDTSQGEVWGAVTFGTFVVGNLIGTLLLAIGLLRSRTVPIWAALAIMAWPPLHVIGLIFFGNEVPQVIGAALQAIGFAGCAVVLLRRPELDRPRLRASSSRSRPVHPAPTPETGAN